MMDIFALRERAREEHLAQREIKVEQTFVDRLEQRYAGRARYVKCDPTCQTTICTQARQIISGLLGRLSNNKIALCAGCTECWMAANS